jgi:hypothetical protein
LALGQFLPAGWVDVIAKHIETLFGQTRSHIRPHLSHAEYGNPFFHLLTPPLFSGTCDSFPQLAWADKQARRSRAAFPNKKAGARRHRL